MRLWLPRAVSWCTRMRVLEERAVVRPEALRPSTSGKAMSDLGYCPECGAPGVKRIDETTRCLNGHRMLSVDFTGKAVQPNPRERTVEQYFVSQVNMSGGAVRKIKWIGFDGAPDRLAGWPNGRHGLVELKRPRGMAEPHQIREHAKLRKMGFRVDIIDTKELVDAYVKEMTACQASI